MGGARVSEHGDAEGAWIVVEQADAHIEISGSLLRGAACGKIERTGLRIEGIAEDANDHYPHPGSRYFDFGGCLVHLDGHNRHVVYRIDHYIPERDAWSASWPD